MKKILFALAALALAATSCIKTIHDPEEIDETPAQLVSFKLLAADNDALEADYAPEAIAESMIIRIPGGGQGKTLKATLTAGENDVIKVNEVDVVDGKASFDASFPVDIVVTNTKSNKSAQYEVKIGKILQLVAKQLGTFPASEGMLYTSSSYKAAVNPKTGEMWLAYTYTPAGGVKTIGVKKFSNNAFVQVGVEGIIPAPAEGSAIAVSNLVSLTFNEAGDAYLLYYAGDVKNSLTLRKFDGTDWTVVGKAGFSEKVSFVMGNYPTVYFNASGNPGFVYMSSTYNNGTYQFDGTEWVKGTITGFPAYNKGGERGSNEGIFYNGPVASLNGKLYGFFTANWYGLYVYEFSGSAWSSAIIQDYMEAGEKNMLPGNMTAVVKDGKILLFAANQIASQEQIYEFDGSKLAKYGDPLAIGISDKGAVDPALFGMNPVDGQLLVVKQDGDAKPCFTVMDENRKWADWVPFNEAQASYGGMAMGFDKAGNALVTWPDVARGTSGFPLWSIGLEDDILPE